MHTGSFLRKSAPARLRTAPTVYSGPRKPPGDCMRIVPAALLLAASCISATGSPATGLGRWGVGAQPLRSARSAAPRLARLLDHSPHRPAPRSHSPPFPPFPHPPRGAILLYSPRQRRQSLHPLRQRDPRRRRPRPRRSFPLALRTLRPRPAPPIRLQPYYGHRLELRHLLPCRPDVRPHRISA